MAESKEFHTNLGDKIATKVEDALGKSGDKIDKIVQNKVGDLLKKLEKESEKTIANANLGAVLGKAMEQEISKSVQDGVSNGVAQGAAQGVTEGMNTVAKEFQKAGQQMEQAAKKTAKRTKRTTKKTADDIIKNTKKQIKRTESGQKELELQIGGFDGRTRNYKVNLNKRVKDSRVDEFTNGIKKAQTELGKMGREGRTDKVSAKSMQSFKTMDFPPLSKDETASVKTWTAQMIKATNASKRAGETIGKLATAAVQCNKQLTNFDSAVENNVNVDFNEAFKNTKVLKDTVKSALALDYIKGELQKRKVPEDLLKDIKSSSDFSQILDTVEISGQEYYKIIIDYVQDYQDQLFKEIDTLSIKSGKGEVFGARELGKIQKKLPGIDKKQTSSAAKSSLQREQQDKKDIVNGEAIYNEIIQILRDGEGKTKNSADSLKEVRSLLSGKRLAKSVDNVVDTRIPEVLKEFVVNYARYTQLTGKQDAEAEEVLNDLLNQQTYLTGNLTKRSKDLQYFYSEAQRVSKILDQTDKWDQEKRDIIKSIQKGQDSHISERFLDYVGSTFSYSKEITAEDPELQNSQAIISRMRKGKKIVDMASERKFKELFQVLENLMETSNFQGTADFIGDVIQEMIIDAKENEEDIKELEQAKKQLKSIVQKNETKTKGNEGKEEKAYIKNESLYVDKSDPYQKMITRRKRQNSLKQKAVKQEKGNKKSGLTNFLEEKSSKVNNINDNVSDVDNTIPAIPVLPDVADVEGAIAKNKELTESSKELAGALETADKNQKKLNEEQKNIEKNQGKIVENQEKNINNQKQSNKEQEVTIKSSEKAIEKQKELNQEQEKNADNQQAFNQNQQNSTANQERATKSTEEAINAEKELVETEQDVVATGKEIVEVQKGIEKSSKGMIPQKENLTSEKPIKPPTPPTEPPVPPKADKQSKKNGNIERYINSENYWMKRFKQGPGEYTEYISKLNPKTGEWENDVKDIYEYLQLEKEALFVAKEIAVAESKIRIEQAKQVPDTNVIAKINDYLSVLEDRKKLLDEQADQLASKDKDFTRQQYDLYISDEMAPFSESLKVQEHSQIENIQNKRLNDYKKNLIKYQNLYNKTFEDLNKELGKNDADINYINDRNQVLTELNNKIKQTKTEAENLLNTMNDPGLKTQFFKDIAEQVSMTDLSRRGTVVKGQSQVNKHNAKLDEQQRKFETRRNREVATFTRKLNGQQALDPLISGFSQYEEAQRAIDNIKNASNPNELDTAINSATAALEKLNIEVKNFNKEIDKSQGKGFDKFSNMRKDIKNAENAVNDLEKKLKELNYPEEKTEKILSPTREALKNIKQADEEKNIPEFQRQYAAVMSNKEQAQTSYEEIKKDYQNLTKLNNDLSKLYNQLFDNREKQVKESNAELKANLALNEKDLLNQIKQKQAERQDYSKKGITDQQANQNNQDLWNKREEQLDNIKINEQNKEDLKTYHEMVDALNKLNAAREKYNKAVSSGNKTASELTALKDTADELEKSFNTLYQNPQKIANDVFQKGLINQEEFDNFTKAYQTFTDTANATNPFKSTDTKEYQGDLKNIIDLMNKYANSLKEVQKYQGIKGDENKLNWSRAESKGYEAELGTELDKFIKTYGDTAAREAYSKSNMANIEGDLLKGAMGNTKTYTDYIDNYLSKIEGSGSIVNGLKTSLLSLREGIESVNNDFQNGAINIEQYFQKMGEAKEKFKPTADDLFKQYDKWGKLENELNEMSGASVTGNRIGRYSAIMQQLRERFYEIYNNPEYTEEQAERERASIKSQIDFLKKNGSSYDRTTNKGTLLESSIGRTYNSNDMASVIREYAEFNNLGKEIGTTFATNGQTVTMSFEKMDGSIIKVKGSLETLADGANGIRIIQTETQGSISFLQQMGSTLYSLGKSFVSYFSGYRLAMMAISQFKEGFSVFKDYDASLTTISYTMDLTNKQLNDMGRSAINMAEEYGTTLSNAMDIYQIYANMQSTPEQISAVAQPTVILSNLTGADTTTASNQIQGILQQFQMLNEEGTNAAEASMHVVDVLDKISSNVAMDYAKGISVITESVTQAGAVAYDAGMSYEQLAAVSAKVAERTREDGSSIGNAIKTIATRISKVGKMPQYADEVSNEELSNASASLHAVGVEVYNADGSFRELDVILNELQQKWDGLTDAQKANISFNIAATRQTSKFKNILEAWTDSMNLAKEAEESSGNAMINEEKYESSISGLLNKLSAQWEEFWVNFYNSDFTKGVISFFTAIVDGLNSMSNAIGPGLTSIVAFTTAVAGLTKLKSVFSMFKNGGIIKSLLSMGKVGTEVEAAGAAAGGTFAASFAAALPLVIPAAIATATIGGLAAYGMYKDAEYGRNVEAFNESKKNYETDTADLDNLKSKLADVNSQIEQIQSQGTITLTDEVQLNKLQQQSKELENQIKLKEDLIKADQEQMKKEAKEVLGSQVKDWSTGEKYYRGTNGESPDTLHYQKSGLVEATESNLALLEKKKADFDKVSNEYEELLNKEVESSNGEKKLTDSENARLTQLKKQKEELDELESQVSDDMANLSATKPYATAKQQAKINEMEARFAAKDAVNDTEADLLKLQTKFENSTDASMQRIKDYVLETASSGQEAITMMEQLGISIESLNLANPENASRYFQDMIDSAKQAKESVEEVKEAVGNTFDAVKSASESANQGANWDELTNYYKNAKDLYEKGLVGTDDFQTFTALITPGKIDTSKFEYASDAYVEAWKKYREKAERYLNGEDAKGSMDNLLNDLIDVGKATRGADDEIAFNFDSTAEAAKALKAPIGVVEASLHKLEEYGAEFDGVEFSGEQLAQYSENLEGLKSLYDSMETSSTKDLLGKKIEGFETEYGELQEDLSQLSEEQIVKIKFEYDLASLQMDVENAIKDAVSNDTTESWAALSVTQQRERDYLEKNNKYDESKDSGYSSITERIKKNNEEMRKTQNDEDKKTIAQNNAMLAEMQNSFLEYNANGGKLGFNDWFQSDQALKSLDDLASQYGLTTDALRGMIVEAFDGQKSLVESSDRAIRDSRKNFQELQRDYKNSKKDLAESEKSSEYDETTADYSAATEKRKELRGNAKQARDSGDYTQAEYYQRQVNGIQQLQAKFQELQNTGSDISWTDFLKTDEYQGAINDILKETGMGRGELERILGVDLPPVHLEVEEGSIEDIKSELEYLGEDSTIEFEAELDDGSMANITASLDENGEVVYTANVDGVEQTVTPILHENGEITYDSNLDKELEENGEVTFSANVDGVEQEVTAVKEEDGTVTYSANVDGVKTTLEALKTESGVIHFTTDPGNSNKKPKDIDQKVKRKVDDAETKKKPNPVDQKAIRKPDNSQTMSSPPPVTQTVKRTADNSSVSSSLPEIKQTVRRTVVNDPGGGGGGKGGGKGGGHGAIGTAYNGGGRSLARAMSGSSFASGNVDSDDFPNTWKTPVAGTSLVGELGREIVVDTNSNRWYTVGDNGAEFRKIPKNAIIFNNDQTEELLSNGSLNGASYASGTAYARGVRWPGNSSSSSKSSSSKSSKKSSSRSKSSSSNKSSKSSKSSKDETAKKSKLTEYLQNIFDWAEYRLKNLSTIADRYSKLADSAEVWSKKVRTATKAINGVNVKYTTGGAAQLYNKAIQAVNKQLAGSQKALNGYQSFYKSVVQKSGLDKATIKKIQSLTASGQFNVETFKASKSSGKKGSSSSKNEKLQNIENVSKWYQKVLETQSSIEDLMVQRAELAQKKLDAIEDIYGAKLSVYENTMKRDQAKMEYILNTSGTTSTYFNAGKSVVKSGKQTIDASREEYKIFERQFNSQVKKGELRKGTKSYNTNLAKLRELESKIYEASLDLQEQIAKTFENIADHFEELRDRNDEKLDVNEGNIDIAKRNQAGYTSSQLRNLYNERNNLQYNNMQLAAQELAAQRANKNALISSNPKDVTAIKAADKAIEAANNKYAQAITDYKQYLYDHRDELVENIENYYDSLEDYFSSIQDAVDTQIDLKRTKGKVVTVGDYNSSVKAAENATRITRERFKAVYNEFKDQIEKGYLTIGSEKYYQALAKVNSLQNDMIKAEQARLEVYNQISQLKIDNIQNVIDGFENLNDTLSNFADLLNDMGNKKYTLGKVDEKYLRTQMGLSEQTIYGYDAQKNEILKQMKGVEKYSDRWNELNGQLQDANSNIIKAAQSMEEFADAIREVRWDKFNKGIEAIDYTKTELSDLMDILNEDNFIAKNGAFTAEGLAAIALQGQAIKQNVEEVEAHRVALRKLKEEYDNNVISLDEYTDQSREHMDAIRDGVSAYQDLRDSIVDLYLEALEKENELLQENIDKRQENLQKTKDYYDFQKTIRNDTRDIQYLQSQIAALNGVTNTNAQSKLASLRSQLADATEQYNDDKQNHYFDLMSNGYNKLVDDANKSLDDIEDAVRRSTEKQTEIIREMLDVAGNEYKNVYATINGILNDNGIILSNITQKSITDFGTEKESITNVGLTYSEMTAQMKTDSEAITGAEGILTTAINKLGMIGGENGKLNEIVKKAGEVKTGFTDIGAEIENITKKFNDATTSIIKTASESLAQIKKLTDEVNSKVSGATSTGTSKVTTSNTAKTAQTSSSLKGKDTSSKNIKDATTVAATGKNAKDTTKKATAKKTYTVSEAKEYAIAYIMQNSQKIAASLIKKAKYKMSKDIASMNGNKTLTDKQVEYLVNHVNSMLGRSGKNAFTSAQIFSAIKDNLKKAISGKGYSVTSFASVLKKYAKGSENIDKQQLAITNESGWEAIYRKSDGAILTPLNVGDKVFTNEMSENLWKLAQGNTLGADMVSKAASPVVTNVETYKPNITVSFENFMTVQGNVDKDVLGDLKSLKNEWMTDFSKHLTKEFGLLGNKRRFS